MMMILAAMPKEAMSIILMLVYVVGFAYIMYLIAVRPQKKQQKQIDLMLSELKVGDSVLTTSGFYGVVIHVEEEDNLVIVEFGNNKNCRIPMQKSAIVDVEKVDA